MVRTAVKSVVKAIESSDKESGEVFKNAQSKIDSLADKGAIHKNKASRLKSRLNARLKSS